MANSVRVALTACVVFLALGCGDDDTSTDSGTGHDASHHDAAQHDSHVPGDAQTDSNTDTDANVADANTGTDANVVDATVEPDATVGEDAAVDGAVTDATVEDAAADTAVAATCEDETENGQETAEDCGGPACDPCTHGEACLEGRDCDSGVCGGDKICALPSCTDGVTNGPETGPDCGSTCPDRCEVGEGCAYNSDCGNGGICSTQGQCEANPNVTKCGTGNVVVGEFAEACGQVNLHLLNGVWTSNPNCSSGCGQNEMNYCAAFFPETASTQVFASVPQDIKPFETAGCAQTINRTATKQVACCAPNPCPDGYEAAGEFAEACGQVNLHLDNGVWTSDANCSSGCGQDVLTYCQKYYSATEIAHVYESVPQDIKPFQTASCAQTINRTATKQVACCVPIQNPTVN